MRAVLLSALKAGMTRLRDKGGASPDALYQLTNGYVDASGAPTSRQGTSLTHTLTAGTKGLCAFAGKLHTFALTTIDPGTTDVVVDVVKHPDPAFAGTIAAVHFAKPFLGYLYVVIEFSDALVAHYWLRQSDAWQADHVYALQPVLVPAAADGWLFEGAPDTLPQEWAPNTQIAVGDIVQPSPPNGWQYTATAVDGNPATTGDVQPDWKTTEGAQVIESFDLNPTATAGTTSPKPESDRYGNLPTGIRGDV